MQHLDVSTSLFTSLCLPVLAINDNGEKINMNVKETDGMYLEVGNSDIAQPSSKQIFVNAWFPSVLKEICRHG